MVALLAPDQHVSQAPVPLIAGPLDAGSGQGRAVSGGSVVAIGSWGCVSRGHEGRSDSTDRQL